MSGNASSGRGRSRRLAASTESREAGGDPARFRLPLTGTVTPMPDDDCRGHSWACPPCATVLLSTFPLWLLLDRADESTLPGRPVLARAACATTEVCRRS